MQEMQVRFLGWGDPLEKEMATHSTTKVRLVKAMVFPVVMYGCESWTIKKAKHQRTDAFELWCWRRLLRVPWTVRRSNQSILKEITGTIAELLLLTHFSRVRLCVTPWMPAHQAPPSMGFSRQEYWSGLPFPSPGARSLQFSWAGFGQSLRGT